MHTIQIYDFVADHINFAVSAQYIFAMMNNYTQRRIIETAVGLVIDELYSITSFRILLPCILSILRLACYSVKIEMQTDQWLKSIKPEPHITTIKRMKN